jgi:hypothetical protein
MIFYNSAKSALKKAGEKVLKRIKKALIYNIVFNNK